MVLGEHRKSVVGEDVHYSRWVTCTLATCVYFNYEDYRETKATANCGASYVRIAANIYRLPLCEW